MSLRMSGQNQSTSMDGNQGQSRYVRPVTCPDSQDFAGVNPEQHVLFTVSLWGWNEERSGARKERGYVTCCSGSVYHWNQQRSGRTWSGRARKSDAMIRVFSVAEIPTNERKFVSGTSSRSWPRLRRGVDEYRQWPRIGTIARFQGGCTIRFRPQILD